MTHPVPPALRVLLDDPALLKIFSLLNSADHSVRLVGGVVRNVLMQRPVTDIDMATTHLPETVMEKARQAGKLHDFKGDIETLLAAGKGH